MTKFSQMIEKALRQEGLAMSDVPDGFIEVALDTLIAEDLARGRAPQEFVRGIITMVVTGAKARKGE